MRPTLDSHINLCLALLLFVVCCLTFVFAPNAVAHRPPQDGLSVQETRGKQIYVTGTGSGKNQILAYLGDAGIEISATTVPCINCHGSAGKGIPEGGVYPSDLTWETLTKPYGVVHQNGRKHPAYTERGLELAITRGIDPAGNKLLTTMPRYQMSPTELSDLIFYLKRLGENKQRGISDDAISIGVIVPMRQLQSMGEALKAVITAFFEESNRQGPIYNRRINVKFVETGEDAASTAANVKKFIQEQEVFALAASFTAGADDELYQLMDDFQVPLIGPLTLQPRTGHPLNRYVFYLVSGLDNQARVLVNFASQESTDAKSGVLIAYPETTLSEAVMNAIVDQCRIKGCGPVEKFAYQREPFDAAGLAAKLSKTNKHTLFFLGSNSEALPLMLEADKLRWWPAIYFPGGLGGNNIFDAPTGFENKLMMSLPSSPSDQTSQGIKEFRSIADKYNLPRNNLASQIMALSAAKILVEGIKRSGRDLTADSLVGTLERLDQYQTGLTPPVTYGPNRRVGASGAYVVIVDLNKKSLVPASPWINLD